MMDVVYIVRNGDINEDLKYSLRSIAKFAPKVRVWIFGYRPTWVADNVLYVPTHQRKTISSWANARINLITACKNNRVSKYFILINDDFILTKPIENWEQSISKVRNTVEEQIEKYKEQNINSNYTRSFSNSLELIKKLSGKETVYNYELHMPIIINREDFLNMLENKEVEEFMSSNVVTLYRTFYGNIYNVLFNKIIDDVKFDKYDPKEITTEWISVFDDWIGNYKRYPSLNRFLERTFPNKCIYEL